MRIKKNQVVNSVEDVHEWFSRETSQMRISAETIDAIGDKLPSGMEPIGDGEWVGVKGGMTLDSGCPVFIVPSQWLKHLVLEPSEGSQRGQKFIAASNHSVKIAEADGVPGRGGEQDPGIHRWDL